MFLADVLADSSAEKELQRPPEQEEFLGKNRSLIIIYLSLLLLLLLQCSIIYLKHGTTGIEKSLDIFYSCI